MKKIITLFNYVLLGASLNGSAQTVISENFESAAMPALPAGWVQQTKATTGWKTFSGSITANGSWVCPAHTKYAVIDDWNNNEINDSSVLMSPVFSLVGTTGAYLNFDYYYVQAIYNATGQKESAYVQISTDGGANWTNIDTLEGKASEWQNKYISLAAYDNMPNLMLAFAYSDDSTKGIQPLPGIAIDNFKVFVPPVNDVAVTKINMPRLSSTDFAAANGTTVKADVFNNSSNVITSLDMEYLVDAGTTIAETISGLNIMPFTSGQINFATAISGMTTGMHTISVTATKVNNAIDPNTSDNNITGSMVGVSNKVQRAGLIEEFTSSTCVPCASFNVTFDPLILSNNVNTPSSNFNIIKYQMNWPSPGNDVSYNAHGNARRGYYGVSGIPDHYTNGLPGTSGNQAEIDACKTEGAFVDIAGTYIVTNDSGFVHVEVKPYFTYTHNMKVHIVVVEKDYVNNKATTSQKNYYHVMRLMLPDGNGSTVTNWTDNTVQTFDFKKKFTSGNVVQGNYNLWSHPKNTNLVVFVQDDDTKQVLQSKVIIAEWPAGISNISSNINGLVVYPNPARDNAVVGFNLNQAANVQVTVTDAIGRTVFVSSEKTAAGEHELSIPTSGFNSGLYIVKVQTEKGSLTEQLSVVK